MKHVRVSPSQPLQGTSTPMQLRSETHVRIVSRLEGTVLDVRSFGSLSRAIIEIRGFLVDRMKYGPWMQCYAVVTISLFCSPSFSRRRCLEQFSSIIRCCNNILVVICVYYMLP